MGFQRPGASANAEQRTLNTGGGNNVTNMRPKNDAYLNVYLPTRDGGERKLTGIGLSVDNEKDKELLDYLADAEDLDAALETLKKRIIIKFNQVRGGEGKKLAL